MSDYGPWSRRVFRCSKVLFHARIRETHGPYKSVSIPDTVYWMLASTLEDNGGPYMFYNQDIVRNSSRPGLFLCGLRGNKGVIFGLLHHASPTIPAGPASV